MEINCASAATGAALSAFFAGTAMRLGASPAALLGPGGAAQEEGLAVSGISVELRGVLNIHAAAVSALASRGFGAAAEVQALAVRCTSETFPPQPSAADGSDTDTRPLPHLAARCMGAVMSAVGSWTALSNNETAAVVDLVLTTAWGQDDPAAADRYGASEVVKAALQAAAALPRSRAAAVDWLLSKAWPTLYQRFDSLSYGLLSNKDKKTLNEKVREK